MALLLLLVIMLIPYVLGRGILQVLYGKAAHDNQEAADCILIGAIAVLGLAEASHLLACFGGFSFGMTTLIFGVAVCVCAAVAAVFVFAKGRKKAKLPKPHSNILFFVFAALVLLQMVMTVGMGKVYFGGDMTLETVNSFLVEDSVYRVNPMTGMPYTVGMPLRLKILCLPTLYAMLCNIFSLDGEAVVLAVVPMAVLIASYLAYYTLAKRLFPGNEVKRGCFMILVALLFLCGDYMYAMDGFGIMHSAFRGVTIRAVVLLPYTFGLMLRRKYRLVPLCILAEACMVWTFYGLGACMVVTLGMFCLEFAVEKIGIKLSGLWVRKESER